MTAHDRHVQAVGFAGLEVQKLEDELSAIQSRAEQVNDTLVLAIGVAPKHPEASEAGMQMLALGEHLMQAVACCEAIKAKLNAYSSGGW